MGKRRIKTTDEFLAAVREIPFAAARLPGSIATADPLAAYQLWHELLYALHDAITEANWRAVREILELYDAVERAGRLSEMYEASYVAFLEDVRLPEDGAALYEFWRSAPPQFTADIKADRGIR